jgi:hypothetical protein
MNGRRTITSVCWVTWVANSGFIIRLYPERRRFQSRNGGGLTGSLPEPLGAREYRCGPRTNTSTLRREPRQSPWP